MENENNQMPIADNDAITPEAAVAQIDELHNEILADKNHPYMNNKHPQHKKYVEKLAGLHAAKNKDIEASGLDSEMETAMAQALQQRDAKQNVRVIEAKKEMDELVKLGFAADEIPDDIADWQLDLLRVQRLNAQGDYKTLTPMIQKTLGKTKTSTELAESFRLFSSARDIDPKVKSEIMEKIIFSINNQMMKGTK